jgi:hypothetical protein
LAFYNNKNRIFKDYCKRKRIIIFTSSPDLGKEKLAFFAF